MTPATRTVIFIEILAFGIGTLLYVATIATEYNRIFIFKDPIKGKILPAHVIRTEKVANEGSCRVKCFLEPNCVSINVGPPDDQGQRTCELNNFTDESPSQTNLQEKPGHIHYAVEKLFHSSPCPGKNFICKVGHGDKCYRWVCRDGFKGENCDEDINECKDGLHNCGDVSNCDNTNGSFNCICKISTKYNASCESQWTGFGSSCYKLYTSRKNWNNAKVNCQNVGGKLVKIETEEESRFITRKYFSNKGRYWIGLSDSFKEKDWRWTDKTGLTGYKNWGSGQPNNFLNQDCVAMLKGKYHLIHFNAKWNDEDCSLKLGYICEKN